MAAVAAVLVVFFQVVYRPWQRNWGSTEQEINRRMPGDEIITAPTFIATRAVTIRDRPEAIWPWIVQIGYKRAGFYSWDRLDNDGIPSADRIMPEYQGLKVGDRVPMAASAYAEVLEMDPPHSMLWVFRGKGQWENATWAWGLYEEDAGHTRLVSRLRVTYKWTRPSIVPMLVTDVVELVMMRECLLGIKRRAERLARESI